MQGPSTALPAWHFFRIVTLFACLTEGRVSETSYTNICGSHAPQVHVPYSSVIVRSRLECAVQCALDAECVMVEYGPPVTCWSFNSADHNCTEAVATPAGHSFLLVEHEGAAKQPACDAGWRRYESGCYLVEKTNLLSRENASSYCDSAKGGSQLVSFNSWDELHFVQAEISPSPSMTETYWTSGMRNPFGGWIWVDAGTYTGETVTVMFWKNGQPNNGASTDDALKEYYITLVSQMGSLGYDDRAGYHRFGFVCEYKL